ESADLVGDFFGGPAADGGADAGDDAVGATEQAAVLHLDEGALVVVEARDAGGRGGDAVGGELLDEAVLVGDDVADAGEGADGVGVAGGVAAHDDEVGGRVGLVQSADELPALGVGLVGDGAGVDDAQVGGLALGGLDVA